MPKNTYKCPVCLATFTKWKLCLLHLNDTKHMIIGPGVQQYCMVKVTSVPNPSPITQKRYIPSNTTGPATLNTNTPTAEIQNPQIMKLQERALGANGLHFMEIIRLSKKEPNPKIFKKQALDKLLSDPRIKNEKVNGQPVFYPVGSELPKQFVITPKKKKKDKTAPVAVGSDPKQPKTVFQPKKKAPVVNIETQVVTTEDALAFVPSYLDQIQNHDTNDLLDDWKEQVLFEDHNSDDKPSENEENEDWEEEWFPSKQILDNRGCETEDNSKTIPNLSLADNALMQLMYSSPYKSLNKRNFQGFTLANTYSVSHFSEAAYFGSCFEPNNPNPTGNFTKEEDRVYLNTHEPFCLVAVGVQGAGKSHTMGVILESCLLPLSHPEGSELIRLSRPMTALVLHYDQNVTSICEATGLISPLPSLQKIFPNTALPREKMIVLVSPSYYLQRKKFYGDYCTVKPLLFSWPTLTADHIKKLMRINENDNQLYVSTMLDLLRTYQQKAVVPEFQGFLNQVRSCCSMKTQQDPLTQRITLLESIVAESTKNIELAKLGSDLYASIGPSCLVVADLTDPLLSSAEANGIFQVLTEQFRTAPAPDGCGKLLVLDEAHKFMDGVSTDGLSNAIVNAARLMRHDGMRLAVSTQSPQALAPELLELVSVALLHRFHSRDWLKYLRKKIPLEENVLEELIGLRPGEAIVFVARHLLQTKNVFHLVVRPRLTADRGVSKKNK